MGMVVACVAACTTQHLRVPSDVAPATEPMPVQGRSASSGLLVNEDFKLGDFDVADVSRGAKSTQSFAAGFGFKSSAGSGYSFDLKRGADRLHGECTLEENESGASLGSLTISKSRQKLACACGNDAAPVASVVLEATNGKGYGGTLKAHDASYQVAALYDVEGGLSDGNPAGYRIDGAGVEGAVDVLGPGRAWLAKSLEEPQRTDVTCVMAGLLLFKPSGTGGHKFR